MCKIIKTGKMLAALLCLVPALGGCANPMPELTEEQTAQVVEYAAGVLMKHNKNYAGKIVSDEEIVKQLQQEEDFARNTEAFLALQQKSEAQQEESGGQSGKRADANLVSMEEMAAFLGISPVLLTYNGYIVCEEYPDTQASDEPVFALTATPGCKLCVLKFSLTNQSGADVPVDVYAGALNFSVIINDEVSERVQATYAMEDLAVYQDTIPAGETREAILVLELKEEEASGIQTMKLSVSGEDGRKRVALQ